MLWDRQFLRQSGARGQCSTTSLSKKVWISLHLLVPYASLRSSMCLSLVIWARLLQFGPSWLRVCIPLVRRSNPFKRTVWLGCCMGCRWYSPLVMIVTGHSVQMIWIIPCLISVGTRLSMNLNARLLLRVALGRSVGIDTTSSGQTVIRFDHTAFDGIDHALG